MKDLLKSTKAKPSNNSKKSKKRLLDPHIGPIPMTNKPFKIHLLPSLAISEL